MPSTCNATLSWVDWVYPFSSSLFSPQPSQVRIVVQHWLYRHLDRYVACETDRKGLRVQYSSLSFLPFSFFFFAVAAAATLFVCRHFCVLFWFGWERERGRRSPEAKGAPSAVFLFIWSIPIRYIALVRPLRSAVAAEFHYSATAIGRSHERRQVRDGGDRRLRSALSKTVKPWNDFFFPHFQCSASQTSFQWFYKYLSVRYVQVHRN